MTNNYDIFISYSRADLERVKAIKAELERSTGALCWMDLEGIESGEQFEDVIISAINRSDTMLFMLSDCSMRSDWALDELDFAKNKRKRIVIVHIEEVVLSDKFYFRYHKYDQIIWHNKPQREKLFRDIKRWTGNDGISKPIQDSDSLINSLYDVVLVNAGAAKLQVVKAVYETCGLGLKEAKDLVDGAPSIISGGLSYADAKMQKQTIEASGAQLKIVKKEFNH